MGNQLDPHVLEDAKKITAHLEQGKWEDANGILGQIDYFYPYQIADLLSYVFRGLPKEEQAESFVQTGMNRFTRSIKVMVKRISDGGLIPINTS